MSKNIIKSYYDFSNDLKQQINKYDLKLLDLDDVVMTPYQYACGSLWYGTYHRQKASYFKPMKLIDDFYNCLNKTNYHIVSEALHNHFLNLAINDDKIFGLTARSIDFSRQTYNQYSDLKMMFNINHQSDPLMYKGVIYAGYNPKTAKPNNKGEVLLDIIHKGIFGNVTSVVFIDDSKRNLEEVGASIAKVNITFLGVHFTHIKTVLDCNYSLEELSFIGNHQFRSLIGNNFLPSDEEALEVYNSQMCLVGSASL